MKNDTSTGQLIVGSFCIIFALIFYILTRSSMLIFVGIGGILLIIAGLYGTKGFPNKTYNLLILLPCLVIIIYLSLQFFVSNTEQQMAITSILFLVCMIGLLNFIGWRRISKFERGAKMIDDGKYEEALNYFGKILKNDPENPLAWAGQALALQMLGKSEEALTSITKALNLKYKIGIKVFAFAKILTNVGIFYTAGVIYAEGKSHEKALEYFDKALKLKTDFYKAWNGKGATLSNLGKFEEALECYNKALKYNPKSAFTLNNKGDVLKKLGKYSEAMEYVDKGLKVDPKLPMLWLTKGEIYVELDKNEEALKYIDKALELDSDFELAKKLQDEILSSNF